MCGITGIISRDNKADLENTVRAMTSILKNRGPDGDGYLIDKPNGVYLGHRRLSIIDLSHKADQPLFNENQNLALVFNGEIYNYLELREALIRKGHAFISKTDSEVLLHGYEEWGLDLLARVNGMFAFAIYDKANKEVVLARDHIGIKPLYYIELPGTFAFASESRAFHALKGNLWQPQINNDVLEKMLLFQFVIDRTDTIYSNVKKVEPGTLLRYKDGKAQIRRYWDLKVNDKFRGLSFEDAIKECDGQFNRSVTWQLRSDVPVGILLSGGLDSSLVAAVAKRHASSVSTFTATFNHKLDESPYAARCASYIGTSHTEFAINPLDVNSRIEEIMKFYDDLSSFDGGLFTIYLMAERIRQFNIKVLLVGEGADEIFGGYSWFGFSQAPFRYLPQALRDSIYHYGISRQLTPIGKICAHTRYMHRLMKSFNERDIFRQVSRFEIMHQLPNHFLMKVDHGTMAHSVEARVPYLDKELVEFAYSIPGPFKIKGSYFNFHKNNEKYILREVAKAYLPPDIYLRKKRGFSIPMTAVLKSNMGKVLDYLKSEGSIARRFYKASDIEGMAGFKAAMYSPVHKQKEFILWRLFMLEVWKRNVFDN